LAIPTVLVPARPGITNALGCVVADLRQDFVQTINTPLAKLDEAVLNDVFISKNATAKISSEKSQLKLIASDQSQSGYAICWSDTYFECGI
jgi:N-methylhydantoinase A